jgi:hypothetical protein
MSDNLLDYNDPSLQRDLNYWTTPNPQKTQPGTKEQLENWIENNHNLSHFVLRRCDLSGINLTKNSKLPDNYNLQHSDLYRANLSKAHLFSADFRHACLMKADLTEANLHCANFENTNLLGIKLDNAKLDNIRWGDKVIQETQAIERQHEGDYQQALSLYQEAEETYRNLRINLEKAGLFEQAGYFFHREMIVRRKQMPQQSLSRITSLAVDLFSGYGEKPMRVVGFSLFIIFICTCSYFFSAGILYHGESIGFNSGHEFMTNVSHFVSCLYFSVVTFTTLGYGDVTPVGLTRIIAAIEAFSGSFTMALFVVVFVKKMTR